MRRATALWIVLALVLAACGGSDDAATTSSTATETTTTTSAATTTSTSPTTTTTAETTTTTEPPTGPLAGFLAAPVEDPFFDSGFHTMEATDATNARMVSVDSLLEVDPQGDRLVLEPLDPAPASVTGVGEGELLVAASVEDPTGDTPAATAVLYALGPDGWSVYTSVSGAAVLAFLETTTDYQARKPNGDVVAVPTITSFDWSGRALFTADVAVFRTGEDTPAFEAEVECTVTTDYECALVSDDGVLRPGDEGEAVEALQALLGAIDYYDGEGDGVYDDDVTAAVSAFQRDYRLSVDGKAGPNTLGVLESVANGESEVVMARSDRVGNVRFATPAPTARAGLVEIFGTPTADTGWYTDACDGQQWNKVSWPGFTAIFTDRSGTEIFDGWHVDDLAAVASWLYFEGGIRPTTTWAYLQGLGAGFDPGFGGFWFLESPPYNNGRFTQAPGDGPPPDATIASFGTGTGAFVSC